MQLNIFSIRPPKITEQDVLQFFRQFSVLLSAGVPIIRSCDTLIQSQRQDNVRLLLRRLKSHLLSGKSLYLFLLNYPLYFNHLICQLIKISEETGQLDMMLTMITDHLDNKAALKKQIQRALFYPFVIITMGFITTLSLLIFIVPRFEELFQGNEATLPFLTFCLFSVSHILNNYLFFILLLLIILGFALYRKRASMKHIAHLPFIKTYLRHLNHARFARHLSLTLQAGIPIQDALQLSTDVINHPDFNKLITIVLQNINAGHSLHRSLGTSFPPLMRQLIEVGEESGELPRMLSKIADTYESDANHLIARLTQLLEPLIMIVLGALIGGMVISLYLPIFNLGSTL